MQEKLIILVIIAVIVLIIGYIAYEIKKGNKQHILDMLKSIQKDLDVYYRSKKGQEVKKEVLLAMGTYINNYANLHYPKLKPIFNFVFNKIFLSYAIEKNMPEIKELRNEKNEEIKNELINSAINFGITKGTELLVNETKNVSVNGDSKLTNESQLISLASKLNMQANDNGFAAAYAEYKTNFQDKKELSAGAMAGVKW